MPLGSPSHVPDDVIDAAQLWTTLRRSYRLVLGVAALLFFVVMLVTLRSRMQFRSSGRLYLGELDDKPKSGKPSELDLSGGHGVVAGEIEIIKSRSLITRAVLESGINVTIAPSERAAPRYGAWLWSGRDAELIDAGAEELTAPNTVLLDGSRRERRLQVRFVSDNRYEVFHENVSVGSGILGEEVAAAGVNLTLVAGPTRRPAALARYDLVVRSPADVAEQAASMLQVSAPKVAGASESVNVVTLDFTAPSPHAAATFLDRLMLAYIKERQAWKVEDATAAETFVSGQVQSMRDSLDRLQGKLAEYRSSHQMIVLDNEARAMIEQIGKYEEQRVAARLQVAALGDIERALKDPNAPIGAYLLGEANDTVLDDMASALSKARDKLTELETRFNDVAPDVRTQQAQVVAQRDAIRNYVASRLVRAEGTLGTLSTIIRQFEQKLKSVPGAELGLTQLSRESEVYGRTYSYLLERQQQTAILKASTLSKNRVLDAPQVPRKEDTPKLPMRLASGPLGLLLGALFVILRSRFARTLQSEAEVRRGLAGRPIFASVPRQSTGRGGVKGSDAGRFEPLDRDPGGPFAEAFRLLRTNLYRAGVEGPGQVVLVTSPTSGDGKTMCARTLAALLSADGKRTLVIDADVRSSTTDALAGQPRQGGLRGVLLDDCSWEEAARPMPSPLGEFSAIASGGSAPPELLSSSRMRSLLADARASFDYIVIDAPSFPSASDALVLSTLADCVLSVLRLQNSSRKSAAEHFRTLSVSSKMHAVVVNDVLRAPERSVGGPSLRARRAHAGIPASDTSQRSVPAPLQNVAHD